MLSSMINHHVHIILSNVGVNVCGPTHCCGHNSYWQCWCSGNINIESTQKNQESLLYRGLMFLLSAVHMHCFDRGKPFGYNFLGGNTIPIYTQRPYYVADK